MLGHDCEGEEGQLLSKPKLSDAGPEKEPEPEAEKPAKDKEETLMPANQFSSLVSADSDDDDDDEPLFLSKKNSQVMSDGNSKEETSNKEMIEGSDSSDDDFDDDLPVISKKRIARRPVFDDSDDEEENHGGASTPAAAASGDAGKPAQQETGSKPAAFNDDLFDAELGSDSEADLNNAAGDEPSDDSDIGRPDDSEEDEEGPTKEMSAALKRRLKEGASKKPSRPSTTKALKQQKEDLQNLHSESQRIVRDSDVRLPYHKPGKLDLSQILAKTQQKQQQFQSLKATASVPWKNSPDLLKTESKHTVNNVKQTKAAAPLSKKKLTKTSDGESAQPNDNFEVGLPSKDDTTVLLKAVSDTLQSQSKEKSTDAWDEYDELPDLEIEEVSSTDQKEGSKGKSSEALLVNETETRTLIIAKPAVEAVTKEVVSTKDGDKPEQDSGYLTNPSNHNSSEENSSDNSCGEQVGSAETTATSASPTSAQPSTEAQLTPKLAGLKVESAQPRLSAGPGDFIDFEDDVVVTPKPTGVQLLLERLVKHSRSHHKKNKTIQISTIQKEVGEDNKEELKVEKISYDLDEEEEEKDPALEKPGAKLVALKTKLKEKMKQKREEARQRREEIYGLDNEEGFGDEEEEELTDMSDSEEDAEEDEEEAEEDMDQEEYTETEKEVKEKNPFVDAEAEDEDDDAGEIEEDELHLALDTQDNDGDDELDTEEASEKPKHNFLKNAMKKTTQSLDLFDEDANTESPTISQKSNPENIEISERPFEQLSGQSVKGTGVSPDNSCLLNEEDSNEPASVNNSTDLNSANVSEACTEESKLTDRDEATMSSSSLFPKDKDCSITGGDSSFSMMSTLIPAGQRSSKKQRQPPTSDRDTPDIFTPSSKSSLLNTTAKFHLFQSASKQSGLGLSLPIEDSQDLLRYSPPSSSQAESTPRMGSQSFHFSLPEDTQSQLLDDDGLLRVKSSNKKAARRQLMLESGATQGSMDELLGLCSGQFSGATQKENSASKSLFGLQTQAGGADGSMDELLDLCSGRFGASGLSTQQTQSSDKGLAISPVPPPTQDNMRELLDLCSGQFSVKPTQGISTTQSEIKVTQENNNSNDEPDSPIKVASKKRKRLVIDEDEDNNSNDSFEVVSGNEADNEDVDTHELASDEEAEEDVDPEDEEEVQRQVLFKGFTRGQKHGKIRKEFVEEEAELSGSEFESDEDYDIDEKDDLLEHELGDDDQPLSDTELRDQVGRVHLKTMIDDDKRQLLLYQERYLPDGDLHSEGTGRMRRFRWSNMDEDSQQDMFNHSDEEDKAPETTDEQEAEWRRQRHEREKFLEEQSQTETVETDTACKVLKLGNTVFKPKPGVSVTPDAAPQTRLPARTPKVAPSSAPRPTNVFKKPHHGSFLTRSKDALAKIAEMTRPSGTTIGGVKNSGKFIFTAAAQDGEEKKPQLKRSRSVQPSPAAKRPRLDRSSSVTPSSILNHL